MKIQKKSKFLRQFCKEYVSQAGAGNPDVLNEYEGMFSGFLSFQISKKTPKILINPRDSH
jgi:hypothetical protein